MHAAITAFVTRDDEPCANFGAMLEAHVPAQVAEALREWGHNVDLRTLQGPGCGAAQVILRQSHGGYIVASDPRRVGQAVGY